MSVWVHACAAWKDKSEVMCRHVSTPRHLDASARLLVRLLQRRAPSLRRAVGSCVCWVYRPAAAPLRLVCFSIGVMLMLGCWVLSLGRNFQCGRRGDVCLLRSDKKESKTTAVRVGGGQEEAAVAVVAAAAAARVCLWVCMCVSVSVSEIVSSSFWLFFMYLSTPRVWPRVGWVVHWFLFDSCLPA